MIQQAIQKLVAGQDLARVEVAAVMEEIADGAATPAQIGAFLTGLRLKGETADEIAGAASLIMGQADEARPVVLLRGLAWAEADAPAATLIRAADEDLFR